MPAFSSALLLTWGMRLACWPFEVEGQGEAPESLPTPPAEGQPIVPTPAASPLGPVPSGHPPAGGAAEVPPGSPPVPASTVAKPLPQLPPHLPPHLPLFQEASYEIRYGLFGMVGTLSFSAGGVAHSADGSPPVVKLRGHGHGSILGLGGMRRSIEADFDPATLESLRWSVLRTREGQADAAGTLDTATRASGGVLQLSRTNPGQPPAPQTVSFTTVTLDPLGMLWRLRTAPPTPGQTETFQLLDGQALWRLRITTADAHEILAGNRTAIRMYGEVAPIFYDGQPDGGRPTRQFTLWLSDDHDHLPLRLEVPVGLADVVMTLTETRRPLQTPAGQLTGAVPGARNL